MNSESPNASGSHRQFIAKYFVLAVSILISGFFIISAVGWFMANLFASYGAMDQQTTAFYKSLSIFDHTIRVSQVILNLIASVLLVFSKKSAVHFFSLSLLFSLIFYFFIGKWAITYLFPLLIAPILAYCYLLERKGFLN